MGNLNSISSRPRINLDFDNGNFSINGQKVNEEQLNEELNELGLVVKGTSIHSIDGFDIGNEVVSQNFLGAFGPEDLMPNVRAQLDDMPSMANKIEYLESFQGGAELFTVLMTLMDGDMQDRSHSKIAGQAFKDMALSNKLMNIDNIAKKLRAEKNAAWVNFGVEAAKSVTKMIPGLDKAGKIIDIAASSITAMDKEFGFQATADRMDLNNKKLEYSEKISENIGRLFDDQMEQARDSFKSTNQLIQDMSRAQKDLAARIFA